MIDALIKRGRNASSRMRNTGEVNHAIHALERGRPVETLRQIRVRHDLDVLGEGRLWRPPHGRAHRITAQCEVCYDGASNEAAGAGHQKPCHDPHRAKGLSSAILAS